MLVLSFMIANQIHEVLNSECKHFCDPTSYYVIFYTHALVDMMTI